MDLILTENVPNLGLLGDQVRVKDGYARNYLLPRGMAIVADSKNARELAHRRRKLEQLRAEAVAAAENEAERFAGLEFRVAAKAGPNGRLYGSVTNRDVQALLAELGYELDRRAITLHEPIRSVGTFGATVRLHTDVKVDIELHVTAEVVSEEGETAEGDAAAEGAEGEAPAEGAATAEGDAPAEGATETAPAGETGPEAPAGEEPAPAEPGSETEPPA